MKANAALLDSLNTFIHFPMNLVQKSHVLLRDFFCNNSPKIAVDATLGRGRDALFLFESLADGGILYGFDVQKAALEESRSLINSLPCSSRKKFNFFLESHSNMHFLLPLDCRGKVNAICFNLGWLPKSDKTITTSAHSTLSALEGALNLINPENFALSVLSYRGHSGGMEECATVGDFFSNNFPHAEIFGDFENPISPVLFFASNKNI